MASAVIRVKRRITDEPFDKFVLNCKRQKTSHDDEIGANATVLEPNSDDTKTILKLAATVSAEDDIHSHLTRLRKCDAEELARKVRKPQSVINKLREQMKDDSQNARYKVINCFRSLDNDANVKNAHVIGSRDITIVDVVKEDVEVTPNNVVAATAQSAVHGDDKFVYDLYLVEKGEQPTEIDVNNYTIRPFDDLVYQANDDTLNDSDCDSEDSNDEANWRNDYPDTDDGSIGEEDMRRAVEDMHFGSDEDNLSSHDDDCSYADEPVHFIDDPNKENDDAENEYNYFKQHGIVRNHAEYYRTNRRNRRNNDDDDDSDEEDDDGSDIDDNPSSHSSVSSVSPLHTCDEDSDN